MDIQKDNLLRCSQCKEYKPKEEFYSRKSRKRGHNYRCKMCEKAYTQQPHARELLRERARRYSHRLKKENPEEYYRRSRRSCLNQYGLTEKDYEELLEKQNGVCAICGKPPYGKRAAHNQESKLHIDHNHTTGKVRGLLCTRCNTSIGGFDENISIIEKAIQYLKENQ